jgi:hypothetical protein
MKLKSVLSGLAIAVAASTAQSAVITIYDTNPSTAAGNFESSLLSYVLEDFDSLADNTANGGSQQLDWMASASSFDTNVGEFSLITQGKDFSGNDFPEELKIESSATGEYGRQALASSTNDLWLDSNDAREVKWDIDIGSDFNAIGFYLADPNDQGGQIELTYADGSSSSYQYQLLNPYASGSLFYTTIISDQQVSSAILTFGKDPLADGWGIDDVKVGIVSEPATITLMGLGLLGLGLARRRTA